MNIIKSLTGHHKDTLTMFVVYSLVMITLSVFISFFNSSYETVNSINETVNVDIYLKNDADNSYSSKFVKTCDDILETVECRGGMNIRSTVKSSMLGYENIDIVSYEKEFDNEHYSIEGNIPAAGSNEIMVTSNLYIEMDDFLRHVNIGDIIVFETGEESYEMNVVGVFQKIESDSFTENYSIYPSYNVLVIGDRQFILENFDDELSLSDMVFTVKGNKNREYILTSLNELMESDSENNYTIEVDDALIKKLEQPIKNTIELYRIIMLLSGMVLFILMIYAIFHNISQRKSEYGILLCLGMKRSEICIMLILENLFILSFSFVLSIVLSSLISNWIVLNMNEINSIRQMELSLITGNNDYIQPITKTKSAIMLLDYFRVLGISALVIVISVLFSVFYVTKCNIRELVRSN